MKKIILFLGGLLLGITGYSQGLETFDNFTANPGPGPVTKYYDGTFLGQDGSIWTFTKARGDAFAEITPGNQGLMLRNEAGAELISGTLNNGISTLEFSYMQGFAPNVSLDVYVNNDLVQTVTSNNEVEVVKSSGVIDVSSYNVTGGFVLKFVNTGSTTGQVAIDDIAWTPFTAATCDDPSALLVQNITDGSADVSWTAGGTESEWVVIYGPTGFNPVTDIGNPDVFSDTVSSNSYSIPGLVAETDYDVYVKAKCGATDYSGIVGPNTFTTLATSTTCDDPTAVMVQNITDGSADVSWTAGGTESEWVVIYGPTGFNPVTDLGDADVFSETTSSNPFPIPGLNENTDYDVYVMAKCGATDFSGLVGPETFTTPATSTTCNDPTAVMVQNITDGSADVSWTAGGTESEWVVIYGPTGFNPVTDLGALYVYSDTVSLNSFTIDGLPETTAFDVYVKAKCGAANYSNSVGPETFTTLITTCPGLLNALVINITDESADVSWTSGGTETEWVIIYGPKNFDPVADLGNPDVFADTVSINSYSIIGLDPFTDYDAYIKAKCDINDYSVSLSLDFQTHQTPSTCPDPTDIVIEPVFDAVFVQVSWTAGGTETEWVVIYGPMGFDPITDIGNADVFSDTVSSNSYTVYNGLVENTDYDVYVKAKCGVADFSNLAGPETFTSGVVSVKKEAFAHFKYYPNPVHDQLLLKAGTQIESVVVYDLLGNNVIALQPNVMETQIDTKGLQNGVYLVKVTLNGNQKTFRLIKK